MGKKNILQIFFGLEKRKELLKGIPKEKKQDFEKHLFEQYEVAKKDAPKIAFIGQTGVGKSTTLNHLFGTKLPVHAVRPATKIPTEITLSYHRAKGTYGVVYFYDMPGVGESITKDKEHIKAYQTILKHCDIAIWVLSAENRAMTFDQNFIKNFIDNNDTKLVSRLVVAINKVDIISPANWNREYNIPSEDQERNIKDRVRYVQEALLEVIPNLKKNRIVAYSAEQNYRLPDLFQAMIRAMPKNRAWILHDIKDIAEYTAKVGPKAKKNPNIKKHWGLFARG